MDRFSWLQSFATRQQPRDALLCYKVLLPNNNCTDLPEEEAQKLRLIETFSISLWLVSLLSAGPQSRLFSPRGAIRRGFLLSKQITSLHLIIIVVVVSPRRGSVPCFYILLLFLTRRMVYIYACAYAVRAAVSSGD